MEVKQENIFIEGSTLPDVNFLRLTQPSFSHRDQKPTFFVAPSKWWINIKEVNKVAKFKVRHETLGTLKHSQDGEEEVDMRGGGGGKREKHHHSPASMTSDKRETMRRRRQATHWETTSGRRAEAPEGCRWRRVWRGRGSRDKGEGGREEWDTAGGTRLWREGKYCCSGTLWPQGGAVETEQRRFLWSVWENEADLMFSKSQYNTII